MGTLSERLRPNQLIGAIVALTLLAACTSNPKPPNDTPPPDESVYTTAQGPDLRTVWGTQGCDGTPNDTSGERYQKGCFGKILPWPG